MSDGIPQISRRKIGSVIIIDLKGELVGPWAMRAKDSISSLISHCSGEKVLINLKELETIDSLGVKAVLDNFPKNDTSGLVSGRLSVMEMFSRITDLDALKVFQNEDDVIDFYGSDFVQGNSIASNEDQRAAFRLKTALPLEFWYQDEKGERVTFRAIITDLSETGLLAEYLDVEPIENPCPFLDPRQLKQLNMKIKLPEQDYIEVVGTVARTVIAGEQMGIGVRFIDLGKTEKNLISEFLGC